MSLLGDRLRDHARDRGDAVAVHAREEWWTYRDLVTRASELATELGLAAGDAVAVAIYTGIEAVVAVCATALADAIPVLVDPRDRDQTTRILAEARPACVVTNARDAVPGARVVEIERGRPMQVAGPAELAWTPVARSTAISHVLFTSGSTAQAKGIVWSQLRAGFDWRLARPGGGAKPSGIVAPLCTGLGLHELMPSLFHGQAVVVVDVPFLAAIGELQALGVDRLKLTPTHVEILLATSTSLPDVRRISIASAPITPERVRALAERAPNAKIARSYGLNEIGSATMVWLGAHPGKLRTVGRPVSYRRVTVRDPNGRMLAPGETGEVVIEVPMWHAVDGYLDPTPALKQRFDNGVLWTGDRGTIDARGFLALGARPAEVLKVGGRSVSAPRIEQSLAAIEGIADVAVVGVRDRLLGEVPSAVFVPAPTCDASRFVGGERIAGVPSPDDEVPRWYLPRRSLPRGPSGKLRRGVLAQEAQRWATSFSMAIVAGDRSYPAFELDNGVVLVDGIAESWRCTHDPIDPFTRPLALVVRRPARVLALGAVRSGNAAVRFVLGPIASTLDGAEVTRELLDMFAGELLRLAALLPGPLPSCVYVEAGPNDRVFAAAGFVPALRGWLVRGDGTDVDAAALAASVAAHEVLVGWAGQRRSATSDR